MSVIPARLISGCSVSATGLFHPSMMTDTPCEMRSSARETPTAGVDWSSRESTSSLRPSTPPLSLIIAAIALIASVTCWP